MLEEERQTGRTGWWAETGGRQDQVAGRIVWLARQVAGLVNWLAGSDDRLVQMAGRVGANGLKE